MIVLSTYDILYDRVFCDPASVILLLLAWVFFFAHALKHFLRTSVLMSLEISGKAVFSTELALGLALFLFVFLKVSELDLSATNLAGDKPGLAFVPDVVW